MCGDYSLNDKDELNPPLAGSRFVIRDSSTGHRFSLIPAEGKTQLLETSHLVITMFEQHIKAHLSNIKSSAFFFRQRGSSYRMVSLLNPPPLCGRYAICSEQCNIVEEVHSRSTLGLVCEGAWFDWQTVSMGVSNKVRVRNSAAAYPPFTCRVAEQKIQDILFRFCL